MIDDPQILAILKSPRCNGDNVIRELLEAVAPTITKPAYKYTVAESTGGDFTVKFTPDKNLLRRVKSAAVPQIGDHIACIEDLLQLFKVKSRKTGEAGKGQALVFDSQPMREALFPVVAARTDKITELTGDPKKEAFNHMMHKLRNPNEAEPGPISATPQALRIANGGSFSSARNNSDVDIEYGGDGIAGSIRPRGGSPRRGG